MELGLRAKTVVITGGGGGIGRACALIFGSEGARVVVSDMDLDGATRVAAEVERLGVESIAVKTNVAEETDVNSLFDRTLARFGPVDVLVNCAGIFQSKALDDLTVAEWDRMMAVNLRGVFLCSQAALKHMKPRRSGSIVSLGSIAGQVGGIHAGAHYAASKAAVMSLTKSIAKNAAPFGIRANCVNPGQIDTPMTQPWPKDVLESFARSIPLGRMGTADEVARVVVFLASDAASFIHGAHIDVNGGILMD